MANRTENRRELLLFPEYEEEARRNEKKRMEEERMRNKNSIFGIGNYCKGAIKCGLYGIPLVKAYKGEMPEMCITLHEMTERGNKNAGVACFEHDRMLDDFLRKPNWFIERLRRYMCMVMPDFSLKVGMPMAVQICNAYINHVMAFYAAEQRINVMPSMSWSDRRSYSTIGTLGRIKIVQCDKYKTNPTATYSNTKNTTYYSYSKEQRQIERICYYRNHRLYKTVDFKKGEKPHTHYWHTKVVGRKRHDKKNIHELTKRDERLMNKALEYNKKGGK